MTHTKKKKKKKKKNITSQIFVIFRLPPFHLKQERKSVFTLWQNHMRYFNRFLGNVRFYSLF